MFFIAPSFQNPFSFCVGINMEMLSAFKNESEFMMYNQTVPIKKTETFGDVMKQLVNHFMFSLKNRKARINDVAAFFHKLGVDWNDEWIPIILGHKLLFVKTQCKPLKVIDRLFVELSIMDQRLVERILELKHDDGKPYVVYLVETLRATHLLQHYRLMTSKFTIQRYCDAVNCSYLKWEVNNKMNDALGRTDVDDSCFDDAEYQINGKPATCKTHLWPDQIRSVKVRNSRFFGDRLIPIQGQRIQTFGSDARVPHNFGELLKIDQYTSGCIIADNVPSTDYRFRIGQEVKCNDDSAGKINRVMEDKVCIKCENGKMKSFRWFNRTEYPLDLTLELRAHRYLDDYKFTVVEAQQNVARAANLKNAKKHQFSMDTLTRSLLPQQRNTFATGDIHIATQCFVRFDSATQRYEFATQP